ncbi:MAG: hypothetical protein AAF363_12850 [Bacteroidota bacterium]
MKSQSEHIRDQVNSIYANYFIEPIRKWTENELDYGVKIYDHASRFFKSDDQHPASETEKYKEQLFGEIKPLWIIEGNASFENDFSDLIAELESYFETVPEYIIREQHPDRFRLLEINRGFLRFRKRLKKSHFYFTKIPLRLCNVFRKLFRYKPYKVHFKKHKLPLRNMAIYFYRNEVISKVLEERKALYKEITQFYVELKRWEESPDASSFELDESKSQVREKYRAFEASVSEIIQDAQYYFNRDYYLVDTVELSARCFRSTLLKKDFASRSKKWNQECSKWQNTLYALFEEWRTDLEVVILKFSVEVRKIKLDEDLNKFISKNIEPKFNEILSFVKRIKTQIKSSKATESLVKKLQSFKSEEVENLKKDLVNPLSELLIDKKLIGLINSFQLSIKEFTEKPPEKRIVVSCGYDSPINYSDLHAISPREFISFETLPKFENALEGTSADFFQACQKTYAEVLDIDQVIGFSISSALDTTETEGTDLKKLVIENLDRSTARVEEIKEGFRITVDESLKYLDESVDVFQEEILAFTDNENILNLRLRISKAKALERSKKYREEFIRNLKRVLIRILGTARKNAKLFKEKLNILSERFILTAKQTQITKEISNFLSESQTIINGLPVVYKRLYSIESLLDLQLFEGRQKELEKLKEAYKNWQEGNYAATVVVGEKWSGLTSFVNYAIDKVGFKHKIVRIPVQRNMNTPEAFFAFCNELFGFDQTKSIEELISKVKSRKGTVVVVEDIQNLFLKKIGGFEALKLLFELINSTNRDVFWVTTSTLYSWQYLERTVSISEYFSYVVMVEKLTDLQIKNIVSKRNRISGYKIVYEPTAKDLENKKFKKLNDQEQQEYLRTRFFNRLNGFAASNVSLALIFWLLSTLRIDKNTITIRSFQEPDLSFVATFSMTRIFVLHALIIHDGLSEKQLAEVVNTSDKEARLRLLSLVEDGIIYEKSDTYFVTPIIFRTIINLLKSKNLIY